MSIYSIIYAVTVLATFVACGALVSTILTVRNLSPSKNLSNQKPSVHKDFDKVDVERAKEMLNALGQWVSTQKPDFVLGVHFSGLMISAKVALDNGIAPDKLAYSENRKDRIDPPNMYISSGRRLYGRVCVVDDITRQGLTLRGVANEIFSGFQSGRNRVRETCYGTLMVVETSAKARNGFFLPDFFIDSLSDEMVMFPWTELVERSRTAFRSEQDGFNHFLLEYEKENIPFEIEEENLDKLLKHAKADYQLMIEDPKFAKYCLDISLDDRKKYRELLNTSFSKAYRAEPLDFKRAS